MTNEDRLRREAILNKAVEDAVKIVEETLYKNKDLTISEERLARNQIIIRLLEKATLELQSPVIQEWLGLREGIK